MVLLGLLEKVVEEIRHLEVEIHLGLEDLGIGAMGLVGHESCRDPMDLAMVLEVVEHADYLHQNLHRRKVVVEEAVLHLADAGDGNLV